MAIPLVRTSERGDLKSCEFLWYHTWVNGLRTPRVPTWSWFGTAIHKALEARYPVGLKRAPLGEVLEAFETAVEGEVGRVYVAGGELDDQEVVEGKELGRAMLRGYVQYYAEDRRWQVIHTEQPFQIDVHDPKTGRLIAVYCGTWDLFVWDNVDKVYRLVDHKTRKQFKSDWSFYDLNDQGGSYLWVAPQVLQHMGLLGKNDHIDGIVFNMLRKAMPQPTAEDGIRYNLPKRAHYQAALDAARIEHPVRATMPKLAAIAAEAHVEVRGDPRAVQPTPLFERYTTRRGMDQRVNQGQKVVAEVQRMDMLRRGRLPLLKHPTEDCVRCPLFDFCQADEVDKAAAQEIAATMLVKRDPYADHRVAMQENGLEVTGK